MQEAYRTYRFSRGPRRTAGSWGTDEDPIVDGAALGALGLDGGSVLGDLSCDDISAELQDLFIHQNWTLPDTNRPTH